MLIETVNQNYENDLAKQQELQGEIAVLQEQIGAQEGEYAQLVATGEDSKADTLFQKIEAAKGACKAKTHRLETMMNLAQENYKENMKAAFAAFEKNYAKPLLEKGAQPYFEIQDFHKQINEKQGEIWRIEGEYNSIYYEFDKAKDRLKKMMGEEAYRDYMRPITTPGASFSISTQMEAHPEKYIQFNKKKEDAE